MLVAVSDEVQPDSAFAAELETRLLGANVVDASGFSQIRKLRSCRKLSKTGRAFLHL
jgi:hypothetical protein